MRRFSAEYLADTRRGMWDDRSALADLELASRSRILDVGCGTGELTQVLEEESPGQVVGLDADRSLLGRGYPGARLCGDALSLPFRGDSFDLVICQALLVNLPDPAAAIESFTRVSTDAVAAIEPDNARVSVESTVEAESRLARRAREAYVAGVETDVSLGDVSGLFREAGLTDITSQEYEHERVIEPPYSDADVESAARKVTGTRLREQRATLRAGGLGVEALEDFEAEWQSMGRAVVDAMQAGTYERVETIPFHVTVGHVET